MIDVGRERIIENLSFCVYNDSICVCVCDSLNMQHYLLYQKERQLKKMLDKSIYAVLHTWRTKRSGKHCIVLSIYLRFLLYPLYSLTWLRFTTEIKKEISFAITLYD